MYSIDDTIAALASAPGGAARGIVRLSGPEVISIVETCFRPRASPPLNTLRSATVLDGTLSLVDGKFPLVPAELYLWPTERSYTRQQAAEIHTLGSPPLLSALLEALSAAGARPAEPGEFTLRAFLAGRIDLTQAEAVLGVIDARGEQDFRSSLEQLAGGLARPLDQLRNMLLELLSRLEAGLDFVEEDIQFLTPEEIEKELDQAASVLLAARQQLAGRGLGETLPRVVLIGWPNVGKSSLFNALARHATALVSDSPGTTRDYLLAMLELGSIRCQLVDTAGVEPAGEGAIASRAQQMTESQTLASDIRLLCLDASRSLNDWERRELATTSGLHQQVVLTKCDRPYRLEVPPGAIETSAQAGQGIAALQSVLREGLLRLQRGESASSLTTERCGERMREADEALSRARQLNRSASGDELIALEIRAALSELGQIVGAVYTDDILDRIFSRFCIGK